MSNLSETEKSNDDLFQEYMFYCDARPLNVRGGRDNNSFEEMNFVCSSFTPEKALLYAVLYRAYADLTVKAYHEDRRSAIKWFECKELDPDRLTYKFVAQALDITERHKKMIAEAVTLARLI